MKKQSKPSFHGFTKAKLATGVAVASLLLSTSAAAQNDADEIVEETEVTVTGSRITRSSNLDTTVPVSSISIEQIKDYGRYSVADTLRNSTANSFGSFVPSSGSTAQSQATVNLLGVGSARSLVLLDGKRLPGSPSLGGTSINVNQIPLAMVKNIDILKGGASAVYGSDAIAGVVNIQLRDQFEGFQISVNDQIADDDGGETTDYSLLAGWNTDRGNVVFAYEHQEQTPIFDRDRPYTAPSVLDTDEDGVFDTNIGVSTFGAAIQNPDTNLWEPSPECDRLTAEVPGFVGVVETSPTSENRYCGFAYAGVSANQASTNRDSIFINADYELDDNHELFLRGLVAHNQSFGRYAPPAAFWPGAGVPANSANNPYDVEVPGRFRWYQIGNRDAVVDDYSFDYLGGIRGDFGDFGVFKDVSYEAYYHHNTTDNKSVGKFYLSGSGVAFNLQNDIDFGSAEGVNNLRATTLQEDRNRFDQYFAGVNFLAGSLPGGDIAHFFGGEGINVDYSSVVDAQSEAGRIGGSAGNSSGAERDIFAFFYENELPITEQLTGEFAIRYDKYDDFGSEISPKFALRYAITDELQARASYGAGFRAPSLEELSQADSFAADFATDWVGCELLGVDPVDCTEEQYNTTRQANRDLEPETSDFFNIGLAYETDNVQVAFDFFDLQIDNAIRFVPIQDLILAELIGAENPDPDFLVIERSETDPENPEFRTGSVNGPGLDIQGLTLDSAYQLDTNFGLFDFRFNSTYFLSYEEDNFVGGPLQDKSGFELQPEYRAQFTTVYSMGDHGLAWNIDFVPSTSGFELPEFNDVGQPTGFVSENESNSSFTVHNVTYTYNHERWGEYRLGVRNLFDKDPILNQQGEYANGYDELYSNGHIGRLFLLGATWNL